MIAPAVLGIPLKGMQITKNADATFSYHVVDVENRVFDSKMYFYPIPQNELSISKALIQNPLW